MTYCSINGQLVAADSAQVSVQDRGFRYGDGVFETIAVSGAVPYQFEWHMGRLTKGLESIKIKYDTAVLLENCRELLHKNRCAEGFLRIQVTRGIGSKGYLPTASQPTVVIETAPPAEEQPKLVSLWKSSYSKISPQALPVQYKLCQGLNSTLARTEAQEHQCFDALLLNENGHICETSSGNIFWRTGAAVYTPSLRCGILEGSTRAAILRLSPGIKEVEAQLEQLLAADAVFIANVAWKAVAVASLLPTTGQWQSEAFANHYIQLIEADRKSDGKLHLASWRK